MLYSKKDFDYSLPEALIAKYPLKNRGDSRMLLVDRDSQSIHHRMFTDFLDHVGPHDLVVLNNTKVIRARFYGQKETGGQIEGLIERVFEKQHLALAHLKSSKRPKENALLQLAGGFTAKVVDVGTLVKLELVGEKSWFEYLEEHGHMPLPPYFKREDEAIDETRYQTVFANKPGAVASPTASLHLDENTLKALENQLAWVTLHVGAGTFQPVRENDLSKHQMHQEWLDVPKETVDRILKTKAMGGSVIAIGTTVVRSLESAAQGSSLKPLTGETNLFITPGYEFQVIDKLVTNFHLPESTLLMLVSAFAGFDLTKLAYQEAIENKYRFFSYGDAMLIG